MWISQQERVDILEVIGSANLKYAEPVYRVRRKDGTVATVGRKDIVLAEEELLIEELADILRRFPNPARHERYGFIMLSLMRKGVPFRQKLEARLPAKYGQQTMVLSEVG
ncbi:hypothetical protein SD70_09840 [Gordoniibacillus kamchatkensis]|uniref:Transposase n=1 Tax=Gordoniibacillus kamchatkensis TaxID=1590651 RepID=A0ABR5AJ77_9BACL|nr:hypothetical protein [Paenibacillus sp. VKM B-2647]KIL41086.1 hypothetical protein SD70_09840 [Paenibacillus sp. VKM B-2647]